MKNKNKNKQLWLYRVRREIFKRSSEIRKKEKRKKEKDAV